MHFIELSKKTQDWYNTIEICNSKWVAQEIFKILIDSQTEKEFLLTSIGMLSTTIEEISPIICEIVGILNEMKGE